jgi:hypothetical protein
MEKLKRGQDVVCVAIFDPMPSNFSSMCCKLILEDAILLGWLYEHENILIGSR